MVEKVVEDEMIEIAQRHGWVVRKLSWIGRRSAMDRVFFGKGRAVFMEFKDVGEPLSPKQKLEFDRLLKLYPDICVVDNVDDALRVLGINR